MSVKRALLVCSLVVLSGLLAGCQGKAPEKTPAPAPAPPPPPPPKLMTMTSKSPEAVAALTSAMDLAGNIRMAEALTSAGKALEADPDFALAHAFVGMMTPGAAGMAELDKAEQGAAALPEAERSYVQSLAAERRGDDAKALELMKAAAAAAPDDWRLQFALGQGLQAARQYDEAGAALEKATQLNPKAGAAYNILGYLRLAQRRTDDAIAALTKYAEVSPGEANPQDSLGEALMAAGKFDEAEASFQKALAIDPTFAAAWGGIAQVHFLKGDWAGGREALAKSRAAFTRPVDQVDADGSLAWSQVAEGKTADALKTLEAAEKFAKDNSLDVAYAFAALDRAQVMVIAGKAAQALPLCDEAVKRGTEANLPGGPAGQLLRQSLVTRILAQSRLGKAKDAAATLALLEAEAAKAPGDARRQSQLAYARGLAALASKDAKGAAEQFKQCLDDSGLCHLEEAKALKAAGDAAGSQAAAQALLSFHRRDAMYAWIEAQAKPLAGT